MPDLTTTLRKANSYPSVDLKELNIPMGKELIDIISGKRFVADKAKMRLSLDPYQVLWLKAMNKD